MDAAEVAGLEVGAVGELTGVVEIEDEADVEDGEDDQFSEQEPK
jgi:hypothetical protein